MELHLPWGGGEGEGGGRLRYLQVDTWQAPITPVAILKALPGPYPGSPDVPEGGHRTRPIPHFTQPATAAPGDPGKATAGLEQPVMQSSRPPRLRQLPLLGGISAFPPPQALGTAQVCLRLEGSLGGL